MNDQLGIGRSSNAADRDMRAMNEMGRNTSDLWISGRDGSLASLEIYTPYFFAVLASEAKKLVSVVATGCITGT